MVRPERRTFVCLFCGDIGYSERKLHCYKSFFKKFDVLIILSLFFELDKTHLICELIGFHRGII